MASGAGFVLAQALRIVGPDAESRRVFYKICPIFLACAAAIFVAVTYGLYDDARNALADTRAQEVAHAEDKFENTFSSITSDIFVFQSLLTLRRYLDGHRNADREDAAEVFAHVVQRNRFLDQARLLDDKGMEVIRVDRVDGRAVRTPEADLQDKSRRDYFILSHDLPAETYFISALDLNVEHGRIELPWKPTVRLASPVFGSNGQRGGVVVANFLAQPLLASFPKDAPKHGAATYLLNGKGYWLAGAPPDRLWGFMFGRGDTFITENPKAWYATLSGNTGQFWIGNRLYTYANLSPASILSDLGASHSGAFVDASTSWKIVDMRRYGYADYLAGLPMRKTGMAGALAILALLLLSGAVSRAIVDRRKLHRLRYAQERRMRDFLNSARAPTYIRDLNGRFSFVNREFARTVGRRVDELVGYTPQQCLQEQIADAIAVVESAPRGQEDDPGVEITFTDGGADRTLLVKVFDLVDEIGMPDAICSVGIDITKLKETEEQLLHAKDVAETATAAKANFLAAMSHEIRTPMNGIVGMVDLLGETNVDADQRKMIGTIKGSARSLLGIIGDILDFSKLEAGRMTLERRPISIVGKLEAVGTTLWSAVQKKSLSMPMFCDPRIPLQVYGDPVRIRQILNNLIGNAIKFTESTVERAGKVVVRADMLDQVDGRVQVRFSVADNGVGMDEDAKSRLFRPFEQADASTVRRFGGTGLGLSICKQLVGLMSGQIAVESAPGIGSTFSVDLWFDVIKPKKTPATNLSDIRVLIVLPEQSVEIGEFLTTYIAHWKGEAEIANGFGACTARLREAAHQFDILVIAMPLPMEDIVAFRESVRTLPNCEAIRFVIMRDDNQSAPMRKDDTTVVVTAAPICRTSFLSALAVACGRASPETQTMIVEEAMPKRAAPTIEEAIATGQLILVAEDNETNRDVLRRQLAHLGFAAVIVDDGRQALDAYRSGRFGLLLTDCHMPVMDGYQLTEAIRAEEAGTDTHIPIVAITANALAGEAERCIEIGMDDFVVKPIELRAFRKTLERWIPALSPKIAPPSSNPAVTVQHTSTVQADGIRAKPDRSILDVDALRRLIGDDAETIDAVLGDFVGPAQRLVGEIEAAFATRDPALIGFAAHKLKSATRAVGAVILSEMAASLEAAAKAANWGVIDDTVPRLSGALDAVIDQIGVKLQQAEHAH